MSSKSGSEVNLFGFNFTDRVKYQGISDLRWDSYGVGANWLLVPPGSPVLVGGKLSFSDYKISIAEGDLDQDQVVLTVGILV